MKMAKLQKATLDPTKISGRCGRLKCCLRYEYETYNEMRKDLPPIGSEIVTEIGKAQVLGQEILAGQLLVQTEDNRRMLIDANAVLAVTRRGSGSRRRASQDNAVLPTENSDKRTADDVNETASKDRTENPRENSQDSKNNEGNG